MSAKATVRPSEAAIDWAFRQDTRSAGRTVILVALARHADSDWQCWPSQATLAKLTKQCPRTVRDHLSWLEDEGLIARTVGRRNHRGTFAQDAFRLAVDGKALAPDPEAVTAKMAARSGSAANDAGRPAAKSADGPAAEFSTTGGKICRRHIEERARLVSKNQVENQTIARESSLSGSAARRDHPGDKAANDTADQFEAFKRSYPSRGTAPNPWHSARQAFDRAVNDGVDPGAIVHGAARYAADCAKEGRTGSKWVCMASTFIAQRRWEQYPARAVSHHSGS